MTSTHIDWRITDARGQVHLVHAVMQDPDGWVVETSIDGQAFSKHCDSWQSVERTLYWLRRYADDEPPPSRLWSGIAAALAVVMLAGAPIALAQVSSDPSPAVREFTDATRAYALLHRQLERNVPALEVTSNPEAIHRAVQAMAAAVRAARADARPGEFFTDALAVELRDRIAGALAASDFTPDDVYANEAAEGIDAPMAPLRVNGSFPWLYATSMFPCVLDALPALPPELQYRIVGNTLVLIDVHADLIVDLLPYVLWETER